MNSDNKEPGGQGTASITVVTTALAAYYADDNALNPCCWVNVYGPPGDTVNCSCSAGGTLIVPPQGYPYEGDGTEYDTYPATLNEDGVAWFVVRAKCPPSSDKVSEQLILTVTAVDITSGAGSGSASPTFQKYWDANTLNRTTQHFVGYNYTTNAAPDNFTLCSVYVKVDSPTWKTVHVVVDGKATIVDGDKPQSSDVDLNADGTVAIMIIDQVAETVHVTLSLPHAPSTEALRVPVTFYKPPVGTGSSGQAKESAP
jgi:hypothetical protein